MEKFVVQGGVPLRGEIAVSGAKNAVLPILAACLLSKGTCVLHNVPLLDDVLVMCQLLREFGAEVQFEEHTVVVRASAISPVAVNPAIIRQMRASNLVLGPILARFKEAELAYPGGCSIGKRPMDLHLQAIRQMGCKIFEEEDRIYAFTKGLQGAEVTLAFPSVGATENMMMAAALAKGQTVLHNAAREPEIQDLAGFINRMGGKIAGAGTATIVIDGVKKLGAADWEVLPDRIECGTFLIGATITGGQVFVRDGKAEHNEALLVALRQLGAEIKLDRAGISLKMHSSANSDGLHLETQPYPGFPTDLQPQMMALLTMATGRATISEHLFENRFRHVEQLQRMGADIQAVDSIVNIKGVPLLQGAAVEATDLRAGAALVLAALAAEGSSQVCNVHYIDRGYEALEHKLAALGGKVLRQGVAAAGPTFPVAYPAPSGREQLACQQVAKKIFQDNGRKFVLL